MDREMHATNVSGEPLVPPCTIGRGWLVMPGEMYGEPGKVGIYDENGVLVMTYTRVEIAPGRAEWLRVDS